MNEDERPAPTPAQPRGQVPLTRGGHTPHDLEILRITENYEEAKTWAFFGWLFFLGTAIAWLVSSGYFARLR